ncbi:MAG TPA: methyltransferase domain-containing protein [Phycisphaerales bacterium]|nr:methyltransferase domain-containing protein [Phycisphaerales bacterium]
MSRTPAQASPAAPAGPLYFIRRYLRDSRTIGAVARSSRGLALNMVKGLELERARAVAELGPGTGAFTRVILERIPTSGCAFFAVEKDGGMASAFRASFPAVKLHEGDAANLKRICGQEGVAQLDAVVSGLPFMSFPTEAQHAIIDAVAGSLRPGGRFATFTYRIDGLGKARRFRKLLESRFSKVSITGLTVWNVPPAVVFHCVR